MAEDVVQVKGLRELDRAFGRFPQVLARDLTRAGEEAAGLAAQIARATVPRVTGALAASITVEHGDPPGLVAGVGGVEYAGWVEFGGTRGRDYVPTGRYILPAARSVGDPYQRSCEDQTDRTIRGYPWPRAAA